MSLQKASEVLKNALTQIETELEKTQNEASPSTSTLDRPSTSTLDRPSTSVAQLSQTAHENFRLVL